MTAPAGTAPQDQAHAGPSARRIAWTVVRVTVSVAALVALYYALPLDHSSTPAALAMLLIGLAGFIALIAFQVWRITVFSTVGFGDITAKTETARLVVTGQMLADLIILGLAIKIIVGSVRRGQQRRADPGGR
jgi:voltage-gated potassium channel